MKEYAIHTNILRKLDTYIEHKKIPNILFHGDNGSGKTYILQYLLDKLYTKEQRKHMVLMINCAIDKGIHYIRNELKFFAKMNSGSAEGTFKSIVLLHADKLTIDAQSALRRCIEIFSMYTRFFIVVVNKDELLQPIISRFAQIYVDNPVIRNKKRNLHLMHHISNQIGRAHV